MLQNVALGLEETWAGKDFLQVHAGSFALHAAGTLGFQISGQHDRTEADFVDPQCAGTTERITEDQGLEVSAGNTLRFCPYSRLPNPIPVDGDAISALDDGNDGQCAHAGHYPGVGSQWTGPSVAFIDPLVVTYTSFMSMLVLSMSSMYIIASQASPMKRPKTRVPSKRKKSRVDAFALVLRSTLQTLLRMIHGNENMQNRPLRLAVFSAGTGSFHCGISLRDETLVAGLRARGHQVRFVPAYLPMVLDGLTEVDSPLILGGARVFLQQYIPPFRVLPRCMGAPLDHPGLLRLASGSSDMTRIKCLGVLTLSIVQGVQGKQRREVEHVISWLKHEGPFDGVILCSVLLSGLAPAIAKNLQISVYSWQGGEDGFLNGLDSTARMKVWQTIGENVATLKNLWSVSRSANEQFTSYCPLLPTQQSIVWPGIDLQGYPASKNPHVPGTPWTWGYFAHMTWIKGLPTVVRAFIRLAKKRTDVRLLIGGSRNRADAACLKLVRREIAAAGLGDRIEIHENPDRVAKIALLERMDLLSVVPDYPEAFGLYLIEANAAGVPVLTLDRGALSEVLTQTGGGEVLKSWEGHGEEALAAAADRLFQNPDRLHAMGEQGQKAIREHFSQEVMTGKIEQSL